MKESMREMQLVILCGGRGTRIRGVSDDRPKPMVEIGDRPILWHIMKYYSSFGVRRFVLALGYRGDKIVDYFANYRLRHHDITLNTRDSSARLFHHGEESGIEDWEVTLVHTGDETMTGGRLKRAARYVHGESFFATYGDGVATVDLNRLLDFHRAHGRIGTITGVHLPTTFGIVDANEAGQVQTFREKPTLGGYINGGYFVFNRALFELIRGDETVLEEDPFRALVQKDQLCVYRHDDFWHCMDHYKDYSALNEMWSRGSAPWRTW